ncbi:MAG: S41 family peptidase [Clostridia bacterium]|nr:S41 family peptidase [Clostridia bacterium]
MKRLLFRSLSSALLLLCMLFSAGCTTVVLRPPVSTVAVTDENGETLPALSEVADDPARFAEVLRAYAASDPPDVRLSSVSDVLRSWGLTHFSYDKFYALEQVYRRYYVRETPSVYETVASLGALLADCAEAGMFDPADGTALTDWLIACYQDAVGDKYAAYFDPESFRNFTSETSGSFCGIGVSALFDLEDGTLEVTMVLPGTPAEAAGILPGDRITAVDGESIADLGQQNSIYRIRGEEGTAVTLTVRRGEETLTFTIIRAPMTDVSVYDRIIEESGHTLGYVMITSFETATTAQFIEAVDRLVEAGAEGFLFDLRANGGGTLESVCQMLAYLLPDGDIASMSYRYTSDVDVIRCENGRLSGLTAQPMAVPDHRLSLPMVVLCNAYTASAAELFTSALRDYDAWGLADVVTVGVATYGKGTAQSTYRFGDGSAITISIAYYQPPCGVNYEGVGVIPDLVVEMPEELSYYHPQRLTPEQDLQLAAAVENLVGRLSDAP